MSKDAAVEFQKHPFPKTFISQNAIVNWWAYAIATLALLFLVTNHQTFAEFKLDYQSNVIKREETTGKFLQLTDIHIDPFYLFHKSDGSRMRMMAPGRNRRNAPSNENLPSPFFGSQQWDSPWPLVDETFRFLRNEYLKDIDFILWTGDNARVMHDNDPMIYRTFEEIKAINTKAVEYIMKSLTKLSKPISVIPSFGNNDVYPHNTLDWYAENVPHPILDFYAELWGPFIPSRQLETFRRGGYFYKVVNEKLMIVSLNTLYFFKSNRAVTDCNSGIDSAGGNQLSWYETLLRNARSEKMSVYATGHIPPSEANYYSGCYERYIELSYQYGDIIMGQFFGHMNVDHFFFPIPKIETSFRPQKRSKISKDLNDLQEELVDNYESMIRLLHERPLNAAVAPVFVAPSVVPAYNPGLRTYLYSKDRTDPDTLKSRNIVSLPYGSIINYEQRFMNLSFWNSLNSSTLQKILGSGPWTDERTGVYVWDVEYTPLEEYQINCSCYENAINNFKTDCFHNCLWIKLAKLLAGKKTGGTKLKKVRRKWSKYMYVSFIDSPELMNKK